MTADEGTQHGLLRVARTRECNTQQMGGSGATTRATPGATPSLKALAVAALKRNTARNTPATTPENPCNKPCNNAPPFVALLLRDSDDDRRHCRECLNLAGRRCTATRLVVLDDLPRRCLDYRPTEDDPDQRPGAVRFAWLLREAEQ